MKQLLSILGLFLLLNAQSQTIQKTGLESPIMKWERNHNQISTVYSDSQNYYFSYSTELLMKLNANFFIMEKGLGQIRNYPIIMRKGEEYMETFATEKHILIFLTRYEKESNEKIIIKQTYSKENGKLLGQETIAKVPIEAKKRIWRLRTTLSPDGSKLGMIYMLMDNRFLVDKFLAIVINQHGEVEMKSSQKIDFCSNGNSSLMDVALSNDACFYLTYYSYPDKKSPDKARYLDVFSLSENNKEKNAILLRDKDVLSSKIKILENGNVYIASILRESTGNDDKKESFISSVFINPTSLLVENSFLKQFAPHATLLKNYGTSVVSILELNKEDIAVICEQHLTTRYSDVVTTYTKRRATAITAFVTHNAEIEQLNYHEKYQMNQATADIKEKQMHLSILPFIHDGQLIYLYNDHFDVKKSDDIKKLDNIKKLDDNGGNVNIMMAIQKSNDNIETLSLTGNTSAGRLLREVLSVEKDRIVVLTRNNTTAYIEVITF